MKTTLNSVGSILRDDKKSRADKSFYGVVESTIIKNEKIVGYNVIVGDSVIETRKMAGANVGDTVLCTTLSNGQVVVTGALNGDVDALYARERANIVQEDTYADDRYNDGIHTVYKYTDDQGGYYYYWLDAEGNQRVIPESELAKDELGNIIVARSLSNLLDDFKGDTSSNIVTLQDRIDSKADPSDIAEQIKSHASAYDLKISNVEGKADNALQAATEASVAAGKFNNYLEFDETHGLQVGYKENKAKVGITGSGIGIFSSEGERAIDIRPALASIPNLETLYLYIGTYMIQYKPSTNEIICRKV